MSETPSKNRHSGPVRLPLSPVRHSPSRTLNFGTSLDGVRARFHGPIIPAPIFNVGAATDENVSPSAGSRILDALPRFNTYTPESPYVKRRRGSRNVNSAASRPSFTVNSVPPTTSPFQLLGSTFPTTFTNENRGLHPPSGDIPLPESPSTFPNGAESVSVEHKLQLIIQYCRHVGLPFQDFLYEVFRTPTTSEKEQWNEEDRASFRRRAAIISRFLRGEYPHTPAKILDLWIRHPYGRPHKDSSQMFSFASSTPYTAIGPVRPALTSFAVQLVNRELLSQARRAVRPDSGLYVHIPSIKYPLKPGVPSLDWRNIGAHSQEHIAALHKEHQPLLWGFLSAVATPDVYKSSHKERENRPIEPVVSTTISKLSFSRSPYARLGPVLEGLFNIITNTSDDKIRYDSRVGNTPSYGTLMRSLYALSGQVKNHTLDLCRDPGRWFWIVVDNCQNFLRRRVFRVGRDNHMNIGMAGTVWVAPLSTTDPSKIFDYEDKERRRAQCQRDHLTTERLLRFVDANHERKVFAFQWLWVLGNYIEPLRELKSRANTLLRTEGRIQKLPDEPTPSFPLPTSTGSETQLLEFLRSVFDFLKSAGQTAERYHRRILPFGGDGLTFELLNKLRDHRQFHSSPFHSLRILNPILQWWHCFWTNDSRIVDRHLVSYASLDPSTLGHSASKIARKIPQNQGKYDYHQATELMYFVADMRMLDCWRLLLVDYGEKMGIDCTTCSDIHAVIDTLRRKDVMPTTTQFEQFSYELHSRYTTEEAIYRVSNGLTNGNIFEGSPWDLPSAESVPTSEPGRSKILASLDASQADEETFCGDLVLARSQDLIREVMRSREALWSSTEGDVGRVWAQLKTMMFAFAGSSHKKYAQYLLETIIDFELESSPQLRDALLSTGVANISGRPGGYKPTDLLQEYSQRMLEAIVQHKGAEFGERFIREGIARNLAHFQRLKEEFLGGVGLERHSQRRSKPSLDTEMRILLKEYREGELHSFRKGRRFGEVSSHETQFDTGVRNLNSGLLKKWTTRMMLLRDSNQQSASTLLHVPSSSLAAESQDDEADITDALDIPLYSSTSNEGDISSQLLDPVNDAHLAVDMMEAMNGDSSDEEPFDLGSQLEQTQGDDFDTDEDDTWNF